MKQTFHTFKAPSLEQAYGAMQKKLGGDAIVIRTTTVTEGGILGGLFGQKLVEITASTMSHSLPIPQRSLSPAEKKYLTAEQPSIADPAPTEFGSD